MCIYGENIPCSHPECTGLNLHYIQLHPSCNSSFIQNICQMLYTQNQQLLKIAENNKSLSENIEVLVDKAKKVFKNQEEPSEINLPLSDNGSLQKIFTEEDYQYTISLIEDLPSIILKEKGFQITIGLFDTSLKRLQIPFHFKFQIELYTMENPPKLLEHNIHGKKILRGTLISFTVDNWKVVFNNIVINEVSSHYPNDSLKIVVQHVGSHLIRPLVINNVSVRARKNVNK
ncbi:hypothetical protein SteCoe_23322 [Stentor coeruleus]|uniref:Uncharacterized protein n=1 Tax=Stentor coeruleus TaxID=5963 RepID=A0A1R2BK49_9CILI|nr:hypothetical protein SteCoe_23322 [Stentor coeruleus]